MSKHPFSHNQTEVQYAVGQPMGALSSWAVFSLSHHVIIRIAMARAGCTEDNCYCMLGDDIVITNDKVAGIYKYLMETLGVEISPLKSHESDKFFEFTKRFWYKGVEITPFPSSGLRSCGKSYPLLSQLLRQQKLNRWIPLQAEGAADLEIPFKAIIKHRLPFRQRTNRRVNRLWRLAQVFMSIQDVKEAKSFADGRVLTLISTNFGSLSWINTLPVPVKGWMEEQMLILIKRSLTHQNILGVQEEAFNDTLRMRFACSDRRPSLEFSEVEKLNMAIDPVSKYLCTMYDKKVVQMTMVLYADSDQKLSWNDVLEDEDLAPLFLTNSIFTMRGNDSRTLAHSRAVKESLRILTSEGRSLLEKYPDLYFVENGRWDSEDSGDDT
jgi:hypothetical protein